MPFLSIKKFIVLVGLVGLFFVLLFTKNISIADVSAALPLETVTMKPMSELINSLLDSLLALAAGLAILFLIIGGIRYIRSWGDSEQTEKAKKMISYVVLGLVIILISYSVIITLDKIING
ncbi:hypothetical protein KKE99_01665 [Patescibacteria group bacterium]|nr:hypothetical protein [Patescibacteria group bacterium]